MLVFCSRDTAHKANLQANLHCLLIQVSFWRYWLKRHGHQCALGQTLENAQVWSQVTCSMKTSSTACSALNIPTA